MQTDTITRRIDMGNENKNKILDKYFELMKARPYNKISIKEIIYAAGVSRGTFYRCFKTKDDALKQYADSIFSVLLEELRSRDEITLDIVIREHIKSYVDNSEFFNLLSKTPELYSITVCSEFAEYFIEKLTKEFPETSAFTDDYTIGFIYGGMTYIINDWMKNDLSQDAEELYKHLCSIVQRLEKSLV